MSRGIIWFRSDIRLADNPALHAALREHEQLLPVAVIDPRQHGPAPFGFERSGDRRRQFMLEGLKDLDNALRKAGSALHIHVGEPASVLARIAKVWGADAVHAQRLLAWEEQQQEREVADMLDLRLHAPNTLLLPGDLPFPMNKLPKVFTAFRHQVEKQLIVRDLFPAPEQISTPREWTSRSLGTDQFPFRSLEPHPKAVLPFRGGRSAAEARLRSYFRESRNLGRYKETRNGLIGEAYSSKLSPWLATGALSAVEVHHEVKRYEGEHGANESTYWLIFELLWRDFFQFTGARYGADLFKRSGISSKAHHGDRDPDRFRAWCTGTTGQPFIDANMRELSATGYMSNRGRQNVASYLVHDLRLDWRMGAYWFEHHLLDYDPCSNWGNWQYVAGVGNDPREGRRFDPVRQARSYDPDDRYVSFWS